jgi:hypothetical protein
MTYQYRRYRSYARRWWSRMLSSLVLVTLGCGGFYIAYQSFRHDAEDTVAKAESTAESDDTAVSIPVAPAPSINTAATIDKHQVTTNVTEETVPLISAFDGQHTGRVQRFLSAGEAEWVVLAYLPSLDLSRELYQVWLLKAGLTDVKDVGELVPRADGSWVLTVTLDPTTGVAKPDDYGQLVIMREVRDGDRSPSGNRIAEAEF